MQHDFVSLRKDQGTTHNRGAYLYASKHHSIIRGRHSHARWTRRGGSWPLPGGASQHRTPVWKIDVISAIGSPVVEAATEDALNQAEPDPTTIAELRHARDAFERELAISQRVKASTLESLKLGSDEDPRMLKIANNLPHEGSALIQLHTKYHDVFAWSYTDMKGLDPQYYQHQIHLQQDAQSVQQRRYHMNPNHSSSHTSQTCHTHTWIFVSYSYMKWLQVSWHGKTRTHDPMLYGSRSWPLHLLL